ncbi:MAG: pseudouridine synthase [Bacteroidetes bacterium]|nr:MAG: pseudouridine synthase [Bacteroidota bacterium]
MKYPKKRTQGHYEDSKSGNRPDRRGGHPAKRASGSKERPRGEKAEAEEIRLNKFIADSGVCSRREADKLIASGVVLVNGKVVTALGTKVSSRDKVTIGTQSLKREKLQYVLLNKPKGYITTMKDPQERKTVSLLIQHACKERIVPVGRLDRNTTGLLLFTNDGQLAKKLTHPKHKIKKIYQVELDKPLTKSDLLAISEGVTLEDGFIAADKVAYLDPERKSVVGIEIHSGKNRIIRRIFAHLGYNVIKLDRTVFAGLTKKDIPRGKYRHLTTMEVNYLRML